MGNKQRPGLLFFSFDVDFFGDRKIKALKGAYGADGIAFYIYLLCEIYRDKGYYTCVDDDFLDYAAGELNMSAEKIGQMLHFLLKRSLFNDTLFKSDKVLTSPGVQVRYQLAKKSSAAKTPITVSPHIWLLDREQTESFIKCTNFLDISENNGHYSKNNGDYSKNNDTKESKVKESKVERDARAVYGVHKNVRLTAGQVEYLTATYEHPKQMIDNLSGYLKSKNKSYDDHYATILSWAEADGETKVRVFEKPKVFKGEPMPDSVREALKNSGLLRGKI